MRNAKSWKVFPVTDSVSSRVSRALRKASSRRFSAFTLAELVVVVAILAVLATVGFLALSGYSQDAKESASKANVRSLYSAIASESAVTGNSPRYYVVHDSGAALSGAFAYVDGSQAALTWGAWNESGTNYSAGEPDYAKLRLDPAKFRSAYGNARPGFPEASAAVSGKVSVGAADFAARTAKSRTVSYLQVVGVSPATGAVSVAGNYPASSWSVSGLVRDASAGSSTGAYVDGGKAGTSAGCAAWTANGYPVPALAHGASASVSKPVLSGTGLTVGAKSGNASCSFSSVSASDASVSCVSWWVEGASLSCVQDVCGGTVADANAHSTATSQSVSGNWARSGTPGLCTWDCNSGFGWDPAASSCKASANGTCWSASKTYSYLDSSFWADPFCGQWTPSSSPAFPAAGASAAWTCSGLWGGAASSACTAVHSNWAGCAASVQTVSGRSYSVGAFNHGATTSSTSASIAIFGGTKTYSQSFSCNNGAVSANESEIANPAVCISGFSSNSSSCVPKTCKDQLTANGSSATGNYAVDPDGSGGNAPITVYCDMGTSGGWWTVVASDGSVPHSDVLTALWAVPTPTAAWMVQYFIDGNLKDYSTEMRVVSISDPTKSATFSISDPWLTNVSLKTSESWYLYAADKWFAGWFDGPHKCNFSIMVLGNGGCTETLSVSYPANGAVLGAQAGYGGGGYGAAPYSWHFIDSGNMYRLGWTANPSYYVGYYDQRMPSYLMVR